MSIVTLFDKSFLQSLSLDEAVMFDNFFIGNVCPIFYVETLADLNKDVRKRTPEEEVRILAAKFPEMHGAPNAYHRTICTGELLGERVPTTGQLLMAQGAAVRANGQTGVNFRASAEAQAFSRWQHEEFGTGERDFAAMWREDLRQLDLGKLAEEATEILSGKRCRSFAEARDLARSIVTDNTDRHGQIRRFVEHLGIERGYHREIVERLQTLNYPELSRYAPYCAHVLTVELFFKIALASDLVSSQRPSNWVDMAYLFYLPFCVVFVSSDKLHRKCAPLLLRGDQEFIWGPDLKEGLREVNEHYLTYPESVREEGLLRFASCPPAEGEFVVSRLWDRHAPKWRSQLRSQVGGDADGLPELEERVRRFKNARPVDSSALGEDGPEFVSLERPVKEVRGSWRQVPKDIANADVAGG